MSESLFGVCLTIFIAVWIGRVFFHITREFNDCVRHNLIVGFMGLLVIAGGAGFFATGLLAVDFLKFPRSFQWPAGYVNGVVRTPDGKYIVPVVHAARVQVYDQEWRFLCGWHVNSFGRDFGVASTLKERIEVVAEGRHYSYTENGDLISDKPLSRFASEIMHSFQGAGSSFLVPTSPFLLIFSSPLLCWATMVVGAVGRHLSTKSSRRRPNLATVPATR